MCWLSPSVGSTQEKDEPPAKQLRQVERAIEAGHSRSEELDREAARIKDELQQLQRTLVDRARRAQGQEQTVTELESRLDSYRGEERSLLASLNARRSAIDKTLGALQRISHVPPTAMLASPDNVTDAVRTSVLLSAIVPELSAQAQSFRSELLALRQIRGEIIRRRARLDNAVDRLKREQIALDRLIDRKSSLRSRTLAESKGERRQIAALSESARDLTNLIDQIEQRLRNAPIKLALRPPETTKPFSAARGALSLPRAGTLW